MMKPSRVILKSTLTAQKRILSPTYLFKVKLSSISDGDHNPPIATNASTVPNTNNEAKNVWSWVPPRRLHKDKVKKENFVIPCIPKYNSLRIRISQDYYTLNKLAYR